MGDECHILAALPPGMTQYPFYWDWVFLRAGLDRCRKSCFHRDSIPGLSSLYQVAILTSYPGLSSLYQVAILTSYPGLSSLYQVAILTSYPWTV